MAASKPSTTLMLMMGAKYSSNQSCSVASLSTAPFTLCNKALASEQQRISTPLSANTRPMRGKNAAATPLATSRLSVALQGLYFCVLALSTTVSAMSRSHGSST